MSESFVVVAKRWHEAYLFTAGLIRTNLRNIGSLGMTGVISFDRKTLFGAALAAMTAFSGVGSAKADATSDSFQLWAPGTIPFGENRNGTLPDGRKIHCNGGNNIGGSGGSLPRNCEYVDAAREVAPGRTGDPLCDSNNALRGDVSSIVYNGRTYQVAVNGKGDWADIRQSYDPAVKRYLESKGYNKGRIPYGVIVGVPLAGGDTMIIRGGNTDEGVSRLVAFAHKDGSQFGFQPNRHASNSAATLKALGCPNR